MGLVITKALPHDRRVHSARNLVQPLIQALELGGRKLFHQSMVKVFAATGVETTSWVDGLANCAGVADR